MVLKGLKKATHLSGKQQTNVCGDVLGAEFPFNYYWEQRVVAGDGEEEGLTPDGEGPPPQEAGEGEGGGEHGEEGRGHCHTCLEKKRV